MSFKRELGPILQKIEINDNFLKKDIKLHDFNPIKNAIVNIKKTISPSIDIIGFCGAPWTLSCYMIERKSSKDFSKTRTFLWNEIDTFTKLINKLTNECANFLEYQYLAGATVLMIFDTWSNMIPDRYWKLFGIEPTRSIINKLRKKMLHVP